MHFLYQAKRIEARRLRVRSAKADVAPKFMESMTSTHISRPRVFKSSFPWMSLFDLSKSKEKLHALSQSDTTTEANTALKLSSKDFALPSSYSNMHFVWSSNVILCSFARISKFQASASCDGGE